MKILITTLLLMSTLVLSSQMSEKEMSMSEGVQNGFVIDIEGPKKSAEKIWKNYAKQFGEYKWNRKQKEHSVIGAIVPAIDPEYEVTIISKFEEYDDITRGSFWIKMDDRYLNSADDAREIEGADSVFRSYATEVKKHSVTQQLKDEQNVLKKLTKDLSKLDKRKSNLHKDIKKWKESITKAEQEIEENQRDQEKKKEEIEEQKGAVEEVSEKLKRIGKS